MIKFILISLLIQATFPTHIMASKKKSGPDDSISLLLDAQLNIRYEIELCQKLSNHFEKALRRFESVPSGVQNDKVQSHTGLMGLGTTFIQVAQIFGRLANPFHNYGKGGRSGKRRGLESLFEVSKLLELFGNTFNDESYDEPDGDTMQDQEVFSEDFFNEFQSLNMNVVNILNYLVGQLKKTGGVENFEAAIQDGLANVQKILMKARMIDQKLIKTIRQLTNN